MRNLLYILALLISFSSFGQERQLRKIKTYNEEGDYEKAFKEIKKYQDKNYNTLNYNYLISLADYYCIPQNNEYNPFKAISIVKNVDCAKISPETLDIYFKYNQDCNLVLKKKNKRYVDLYFEIIYQSNDLDKLKSFYNDFNNYNEYIDKIYQKIALISFNNAKQSNSKSELLKFIAEFTNTSFASEAKVIIEFLDYRSVTSTNTIESYTSFLKNYPQTNKRDKILSKLETLKWQECVTLNSKTSYQTFINDFPNSRYLEEAKKMLSKFVDVYNLKAISSFTTLSNKIQIFKPFKISNGYIEHPKLSLLKISQNGKIALAVTSLAGGLNRIKSDNIARLIDLTDGAIIFEFSYLSLSNYLFNSDASKLFYRDNNIIKQLDLNSFDITNLFELEVQKGINMFLEKNIIHLSRPSNYYEWLHITYDLTTEEKDLENFKTINDLYSSDNTSRTFESKDFKKEFNFLSGSTKEKLFKLKLIYGNNINIMPLTKNSTNEYLIFKNPKWKRDDSERLDLFVIKNGEFISFTDDYGEIWDYYPIRGSDNDYLPYLIRSLKTTNNKIVQVGEKIFILDLDFKKNIFSQGKKFKQLKNEISLNRVAGTFRKDIMFTHLDEKTNRLYYQVEDLNSNLVDENEIYVYNYSNKFFSSKKGLQDNETGQIVEPITGVIIKNKLYEIDRRLSSFYNTHINSEVVKNQPLESDKEKYNRVRNIYLKMKPAFNEIQDSLFYSLNETVKDSIKIVKYDPIKVFLTPNYNLDGEYWRLPIKNPFNGKDFSVFFNQPKVDARLNLSNNFSNILLEVKYYLNIMSLTYEPIMVSITNDQSKKSFKIIVPYKDKSLLKNMHFTDNSFLTDTGSGGGWNGPDFNLNYDENILRYFVNNGKPKFYFNYYKEYEFNQLSRTYESDRRRENLAAFKIRNLDESSVNTAFQNIKIEGSANRSIYLVKLDNVPYFINVKSNDVEGGGTSKTYVYKLNKNTPIDIIDDVQNKGQSYLPNSLEIKNTILKEWSNSKEYNQLIKERYYTPSQATNLVSSFWPSVRSPNGKYFAVKVNTKTYLYETSTWTNLMNFDNTTGKLYWDCNSYYLGVGNDLIPVLLLDSLGSK